MSVCWIRFEDIRSYIQVASCYPGRRRPSSANPGLSQAPDFNPKHLGITRMRPPKDPSLASPSTLKWWRCQGVVYFLGVGDPISAIKIGMLAVTETFNFQTAVMRRVGQMQTSNHEPIQILGIIQFSESEFPTRTAEATERELHLKYAHLARFRPGTKGSEWFNCSAELLEEISNISVLPETLGIPRCIAALSAPST